MDFVYLIRTLKIYMWNNVVVFTLFVMLLQIDNIITFVLELLKRVGDLKSLSNVSRGKVTHPFPPTTTKIRVKVFVKYY